MTLGDQAPAKRRPTNPVAPVTSALTVRHSGSIGPMEVRDLSAADEEAWRTLWDGYCAFYEKVVPAEVTAATWRRLLDPDWPVEGLVAERGGELVGFVNCVLHPSTWGPADTCYLEDLSCRPPPAAAGQGAR